jgi:lipopolysaccharide/colanic/teichoic acid biosynthesis glycosyltransferase
MKRVFDILLSLVGLTILTPVLLAIAVGIAVCDGRPVFFRQERIGYRGRPFLIWKFRTMRNGEHASGRQVTVAGDPRITRLGGWLRRTKLDELPQLFNVLAGEMSFVGPRPEVERYVRTYSERQRRVLELKPGITDAASIAYRDESTLLAKHADPERIYLESIVPAKIRLNLVYARRATVWRDLILIVRTLVRLVRI